MKNSLQPPNAGAPAGKFHCVTFILGGELFAIEIRYIREIIEFDGITRVPMMPGTAQAKLDNIGMKD